jgi:sugar-phosphatase
VVTSGTRIVARARMAAAGLREPPVLITAEDVPAGKPDPAPYLVAAARLDLDPADCLAVEDSPVGLASARAAGCVTVAVATTHRRHELDADIVVTDLSCVEIVHDGDFTVLVRPDSPGTPDAGPV